MPTPGITYTFSSSSRDQRGKSYLLTHAFRGFSTSFSHSFVDQFDDKGDTCSLACCGLLQAQRNRFLFVGNAPSLFALQFTIFVVVPAFLFAAGVNLICKPVRQKHEFSAGVALLVITTLYFLVQMVRKTLDQVWMRREVLKRKYGLEENAGWVDGQSRNNPYEAEDAYLMGQTRCDLFCAHIPCGCYEGDVAYEDMEAPQPGNMCDCMWQSTMACCCEYLQNRFFQCCGVCGVAQESRDIDKMFPPHHRAFDYVTMQPVLEYYSFVLDVRVSKMSWEFSRFLSLSSLSRNIFHAFLTSGLAIALFTYLFDVWHAHFAMVATVFLVANVFLCVVHYRYTSTVLSEDAVIKGFASGFYIAGTMALPFLVVLMLITELAMHLSLEYSTEGGGHFGYGYSMRGAGSNFFTPWKTNSGLILSRYRPIVFLCFSFFQCFVLAFVEELAKLLAFRMISDHPDFWTRADLEKMVSRTRCNEHDTDADFESLPFIDVKTHVRSLRSRCSAIVVTVLSVSLGFASFENILCACIYYFSNVTWWDLLARLLLLSVAPVSAVFQAIGICQGSLESKVYVKVGSIIRPAVIFHGLFDFAVIVGDYIAESKFREGYLRLMSRIVVPLAVLVLASCWAALSLHFLKCRLDDKDPNTIDVRNTWNWNSSNWQTSGSHADKRNAAAEGSEQDTASFRSDLSSSSDRSARSTASGKSCQESFSGGGEQLRAHTAMVRSAQSIELSLASDRSRQKSFAGGGELPTTHATTVRSVQSIELSVSSDKSARSSASGESCQKSSSGKDEQLKANTAMMRRAQDNDSACDRSVQSTASGKSLQKGSSGGGEQPSAHIAMVRSTQSIESGIDSKRDPSDGGDQPTAPSTMARCVQSTPSHINSHESVYGGGYQTTARTTMATAYRYGTDRSEGDTGSETSVPKERWVHLKKSLDEILNDIRAGKKAIIYRPGEWVVDVGAHSGGSTRVYEPPTNLAATSGKDPSKP